MGMQKKKELEEEDAVSCELERLRWSGMRTCVRCRLVRWWELGRAFLEDHGDEEEWWLGKRRGKRQEERNLILFSRK